MNVRAVMVFFVLAATMWVAGCDHYVCTSGATFGNSSCNATGSGGGVGNSGGDYVYVTDPGGIQSIVLDPAAGTLTASSAITGLSTTLTPDVMVIAANKYMYVSYPSSGEILAWELSGDGTMQAINSGQPYAATYMTNNVTTGSQNMIVNPAGSFLFAVDQTSGSTEVHVYQISSGGALTELSPLLLPSGFVPFNLATDGLGKYLYVSNVSGSATTEIAAYTIGSSGTMTAVTGSPFALNLTQMQGDPSGAFLIGTTATLNNADANIYTLGIQSGGAIAQIVGSPLATTNPPTTVTVGPSTGGTLVYSFNTSSTDIGNTVEGFTLNPSTGVLTELNSGTPFSVTGDSGQFLPTTGFLFIRDQFNKDMSVFTVSASSDALTTPTASVGWQTGTWPWATAAVQ